VHSAQKPDGREFAQSLICVMEEFGIEASIHWPPVVASCIASTQAKQIMAVEAAVDAFVEEEDDDPCEDSGYDAPAGPADDPLDEDQERVLRALEDGVNREPQWFEKDPEEASHDFRMRWWENHFARLREQESEEALDHD